MLQRVSAAGGAYSRCSKTSALRKGSGAFAVVGGDASADARRAPEAAAATGRALVAFAGAAAALAARDELASAGTAAGAAGDGSERGSDVAGREIAARWTSRVAGERAGAASSCWFERPSAR